MARYIVAVDRGGAFSDLVALDTKTGQIRTVEVGMGPLGAKGKPGGWRDESLGPARIASFFLRLTVQFVGTREGRYGEMGEQSREATGGRTGARRAKRDRDL